MWRIMVGNYLEKTVTFAMVLLVSGTDHIKK